MNPKQNAGEEVAATDVVFEQLAAEPEGQAVVVPDPDTQPAPQDVPAPLSGEAGQSPVGDYVRELQEEFEEQEDEVKL